MTTERLAVRIDRKQKQKLEELAEMENATVSETVRKIIDEAYEGCRRRRRIEAAEHLAAMEISEVPDPDELSPQMAAKYDLERLP
jgi:hypothetical protein